MDISLMRLALQATTFCQTRLDKGGAPNGKRMTGWRASSSNAMPAPESALGVNVACGAGLQKAGPHLSALGWS